MNEIKPTQVMQDSDSIGVKMLWRLEWQLKQQGMVQWLYPLVIFAIIITLFPLAVGAETMLLQRLAVPAVWIAALLSLVIGVEGLFKPALDQGVLAQLVVTKSPLPLWVLVKLTVHWLFSAGMVAVLSMLATPLFLLPWQSSAVLALSVLLGSPMLLLLAAVASSLTVSLKNAAVLVPLIALPMQLPVLIFATGAVDLYATGMNPAPILALLAAGSILAIISLPWVIAYSLKMTWLS